MNDNGLGLLALLLVVLGVMLWVVGSKGKSQEVLAELSK